MKERIKSNNSFTLCKGKNMIKMPSLFLVLCFCAGMYAQQNMKAYSNYDFVPGDKVLFEDDFSTAMDGEFAPLWKLMVGQAVVNKVDDKNFLFVSEGNFGLVKPRIKAEKYLGNEFTVEADYVISEDGSGLIVILSGGEDDNARGISFDNSGTVSSMYFPESGFLSGQYPFPDSLTPGKIVHTAIVYKNRQMKCYINQSRVLVIPEVDYTPAYLIFGGIAPVRFSNVRIAEGGGMNMLDKLYKDGKLVTHGITFESGKAVIKPQSMGTINEIVALLNKDAKIKLSVEGHTDSDGDDKSNQVLSEKRAEAVKNLLVELKIDAGRLTTKGFGESKPLADNNTPEGKANNRRVEFVLVK